MINLEYKEEELRSFLKECTVNVHFRNGAGLIRLRAFREFEDDKYFIIKIKFNGGKFKHFGLNVSIINEKVGLIDQEDFLFFDYKEQNTDNQKSTVEGFFDQSNSYFYNSETHKWNNNLSLNKREKAKLFKKINDFIFFYTDMEII